RRPGGHGVERAERVVRRSGLGLRGHGLRFGFFRHDVLLCEPTLRSPHGPVNGALLRRSNNFSSETSNVYCNAGMRSASECAMKNMQPWWKEPTRKQWAAFTAAWVGWVLDAFDFTIYIVVASHMIREFGVTPTAIGGSITLTL